MYYAMNYKILWYLMRKLLLEWRLKNWASLGEERNYLKKIDDWIQDFLFFLMVKKFEWNNIYLSQQILNYL